MDTPLTVSYRKLPIVLTTQDELYSLVVAVAQIFQSTGYAARLAEIGVSYMDLANDYYVKYLEGGNKPTCRKPVRNGKKTRKAVVLELPIKKSTAYYIVQRDMFTRVTGRTPVEQAGFSLISIEHLLEQEHERNNHEGI